MEKLIDFFSNYILDVVIFLVAMSILIVVFQGKESQRVIVEDTINQKYNVYEVAGEYTAEITTKSAAEVLAEIKEVKVTVPIKVNGYYISADIRNNFIKYHDASGILQYLNERWNYEATYSINEQGEITEIIYEPVF